jgi:hypothetical protein
MHITIEHFVGFLLLPWFSYSLVFFPLQLNQSWLILCIVYGDGVGTFFVCLLKLYLSYQFEGLLALFNFDKIDIKSNISLGLISDVNNSKKTNLLLGF